MTSRREGTDEVAAQACQQSQQIPDQPKAHAVSGAGRSPTGPASGSHQSTRPGASANSFGIASPDGCIRVVAVIPGGPRSSRATSAGGSVGPLAGVVDEAACLEQQISHLISSEHTVGTGKRPSVPGSTHAPGRSCRQRHPVFPTEEFRASDSPDPSWGRGGDPPKPAAR